MTIYDASVKYRDRGVPLMIVAGKEYGSGSSRDWAAKGTLLLGVKAVLAESFERIHRSNLVNMGVLPLQFRDGETAASHKLNGRESFDIVGVGESLYAARRSDGPGDVGRTAASTRSSRRCASTRPRSSSLSATEGSSRTCCASCCGSSTQPWPAAGAPA